MQGDGEHAHLHHAQAGNRQSAQLAAVLVLHLLPLVAGLEGPHPVTQGVYPGEDFTEGYLAGVKADIQPALLQVYPGRMYARQSPQGLLDQPGAGGAGHAAQQQAGAGGAVCIGGGKSSGQFRVIVDQVAVAGGRLVLLGALVVGRALLVETFQAVGRYKPGYSATAGAAHGPQFTADSEREIRPGRHWLTAVVTGSARGCGRRFTRWRHCRYRDSQPIRPGARPPAPLIPGSSASAGQLQQRVRRDIHPGPSA